MHLDSNKNQNPSQLSPAFQPGKSPELRQLLNQRPGCEMRKVCVGVCVFKKTKAFLRSDEAGSTSLFRLTQPQGDSS